MKLILPSWVMVSNNELIRMHYFKRGALRGQIAWALREAYGEPFPTHGPKTKMNLKIVSYRERSLDKDNLIGGAKLLVDEIKKARLIRDDSPEWCNLTVRQKIDKINPRTEVKISTCE